MTDFVLPDPLSTSHYQRLRHHHSDGGVQALLTAGQSPAVVPPGEHMGPFVIDHAGLVVEGSGAQTVLWNHYAPVLFVLAPDVTIRNLQLAVTVMSPAVHLLYADGCMPTIDNTVNEIRMEAMSKQELINLGTLVGDVEYGFPLLMSSRDDWNRPAAMPTSVTLEQITPSYHNRRRGFGLRVRLPAEDGYLIEPMTLVDDGRNRSLDLLIFARVVKRLSNNDTTSNPVLITRSGLRVFLHTPLELTDRQMTLITGNAINDEHRKGRYAMLIPQRDHLILWLAATPKGNGVSLGSHKVGRWQGTILSRDQEIVIDGERLTIGEEKNPPLKLPRVITVDISSTSTQQIVLPVELNRGLLRSKPWSGTVRSLVPWLRVRNPGVNLTHNTPALNVELELDTSSLSAENGQYRERAALVVHNRNDMMFVDVIFEFNIADYRFVCEPPELIFTPAQGGEFYEGELDGSLSQFTIRNTGRNVLDIVVRPYVNWVEVPEKAHSFQLPPNQHAEVPVKLNGEANALEAGSAKHEKVIRLEAANHPEMYQFLDTAPLQIKPSRLPVIAFLQRPQPFPRYNVAERGAVRSEMTITNSGVAAGDFRLEVADKLGQYTRLSQSSGTLNAGEKITIQLEIDEGFLQPLQSPGTHALRLELYSGRRGQPADTPVTTEHLRLEVVDMYPQIEVEGDITDLGEWVEGQTTQQDASEFTLRVRNTGQANFDGKIRCVESWLPIEARLTLASGEERDVKMPIDARRIRKLGVGVHEATIGIETKPRLRHPVRHPIRLAIKPALPLPKSHDSLLWFGRIEQGESLQGKSAEDHLVIGNYGHAPWRADIEVNVPWLSVPLYTVELPPGTIMRLPVRLTPATHDLRLGAHEVRGAVRLLERGGGSVIDYTARLIIDEPVPRIHVSTTMVDLGVIVTGGSLPTPQEVILRNTGSLDWDIDHRLIRVPEEVDINNLPDRLPAGGQHIMRVSLNQFGRSQREPAIYAGDIIISDGREIEITIEVQWEIVPLAVYMQPEQLTLYTPAAKRTPRYRGRKPDDVLRIVNDSKTAFQFVAGMDVDADLAVPNWIKFESGIKRDQVMVVPPGKTLEAQLVCTMNGVMGEFPLVLRLPNGDEEVVMIKVIDV